MQINTPEGKIDLILGILLNKFPFYGRAAMYMQWSVREDLPFPTAATDGSNVWFHPEYLMKMNNAQLLYTAIHEVQHVIRKHNILRKGREPLPWNIACDHKINLELNQYMREVGSLLEKPPNICEDKKYEGSEWLEEDVYDDLMNSDIKFEQYSTGLYEFSDTDSASEAEENRRIDRIIEASAKVARDAGKMPGFMEEYYNKNKQHQVDWKAKLRRLLAPLYPTDCSWERLNRRAISRNMYVPGVIKSGVSNLAIAVDTSGSVSDEEVDCFIAELNYIVNELRPNDVQVVWFNYKPWLIETYTQGKRLEVPKGIERGGTSFQNAFEKITNKPKAVICLTDMEDSFEFKRPDCPTIWVATTDKVAPWGDTVKIKV